VTFDIVRVFLFQNASKQRERERAIVCSQNTCRRRKNSSKNNLNCSERKTCSTKRIHCRARTGSARTKRVVFTDAFAGKSVRAIES
jgi:hypothetical protein